MGTCQNRLNEAVLTSNHNLCLKERIFRVVFIRAVFSHVTAIEYMLSTGKLPLRAGFSLASY